LRTFSIVVSKPVRNAAAFDGWHGSMKQEGRRTISYFSFSTFAAISGYRPIL
jgi:hypothetical protein